MLKGFIIFLTATACPVSWSFAELFPKWSDELHRRKLDENTRRVQRRPCRRAANRYTCAGDQYRVRARVQFGVLYLLVISKVVPKIWARTNSAMMSADRPESRRWNDEKGNALDVKVCRGRWSVVGVAVRWGSGLAFRKWDAGLRTGHAFIPHRAWPASFAMFQTCRHSLTAAIARLRSRSLPTLHNTVRLPLASLPTRIRAR